MIITQENTKRFPPLLNIVCTLWLAYMFGCAAIRGLLVFYATDKLGMTVNDSYLLYAAYGAINSVICFIGGWLGANYFGYRLATHIGLILYGIGIIIIGMHSALMINLGLATMAIGSGIFIPSVNSLLSNVFNTGDPRRNSAFTISYTTMNIGAFLGYCISGFIEHYIGYTLTFLLAGLIVLFGALFMQFYKKVIIDDEINENSMKLQGCVITVLSLIATILLLRNASLCDYLMTLFGIIAIAALVIIGLREWKRNNNLSWLKYAGLGFISIFFWSLYQMKASFLNFYIKDFVDRVVSGIVIPAASFQALNPIFTLFIGIFLAALWIRLERRNIHIRLVNKFTFAVLSMGIAYLLLALGGMGTHGETHIIWICIYFLFMSLGEMIIAPTGYAMIGELFPDTKTQGILQGLWNIFNAIGYALSGLISVKSPVLLGIHDEVMTLPDDDKVFLLIGFLACAAAIVIWGIILLAKRKKAHI